MRNFIYFTKKEFLEGIKTYKVLILLAVFLLFGMTSSILAKMTPELISKFGTSGGMKISMPKPTSIDAYTQFFKNISPMGIVVLILVFGGTLSGELSKGTLINMLSKGLTRRTVILSKYATSIVIWSVSYAASALINYGYTIYLFGNKPMKHLFLSLFCLWLFGDFVLAVVIFSNTIASGSYIPLLFSAVFLGALIILNIIPKLQKFNPIALATNNVLLLKNIAKVGDLYSASIVTFGLTIIFLFTSVLIFNEKQV